MSPTHFALIAFAVLIGLSLAVIAAVLMSGEALDRWVKGGRE